MGGLSSKVSSKDWTSCALGKTFASGFGLFIPYDGVWYEASVTSPHPNTPPATPMDCPLAYTMTCSTSLTSASHSMPSSLPSKPHLSKGGSLSLNHSPWTPLQHLSSAPSAHSSLTRSLKANTCSVSQLSTPALEVPPLTYPDLGPWQLLFSFIFWSLILRKNELWHLVSLSDLGTQRHFF